MVSWFRNDEEAVYKTIELHCADGLTYWVTGCPQKEFNKITHALRWGSGAVWEIPVKDLGTVTFVTASVVLFFESDEPKDAGERVFVYDPDQQTDDEDPTTET